MKFISIKVSNDNNLMYLFYTSEIAFSVDSTNPYILIKCLDKSFDKEYYLPEEIEDLPKINTSRKLLYSFTTHHHLDHSSGDKLLKKLVPFIIQINGEYIDQNYNISGISVQAFSIPCHTRDSTCYLIDDKYLCTGDTIFYLGCGKFFEGDGGDMLNNINKIKKFKDDILLLYGHDYRKSNISFIINNDIPLVKKSEIAYKEDKIFLTLEEEKKLNPFFLVKNKKEMQNLRDLKNKHLF